MIIGYGRVSSRDQNLNLQDDALRGAGCEQIFMEKASGTKKVRPELDRMRSMLRFVAEPLHIHRIVANALSLGMNFRNFGRVSSHKQHK